MPSYNVCQFVTCAIFYEVSMYDYFFNLNRILLNSRQNMSRITQWEVCGLMLLKHFRLKFSINLQSYYNVQVRIGDYDLTLAGETSLTERTLGVASIRQGQQWDI